MQTVSEKTPKKVDKDLQTLMTSLPVWLVYSFAFFFAWIPFIIVIAKGCSSDTDLKPNEIGDMIGGLTAPIIGLLNGVFVYAAFRQQLKANQMQRQALEEEREQFFQQNEIQKQALEEERERFFQQNEYTILLRLFERFDSQITELLSIKSSRFQSRPPFHGANTINSILLGRLHTLISNNRENLTPENQAFLFDIKIEPDGSKDYTFRKDWTYEMMMTVFQMELDLPRKTLRSYLDYDYIDQYKVLLDNVLRWCQRLDNSKLNQSEKIEFAQSYMKFLYTKFFNLSGRNWLDNFLTPDDSDYKYIKDAEEQIQTILKKYE